MAACALCVALWPWLSCAAQGASGTGRGTGLAPAARPAPDLPWPVLVLLLLVAVIVAAAVIVSIRRMIKGDRDLTNFTLEDLRQMRDRRVISADEFERARHLLAQRELADYKSKTPSKR